MYLAPVSMHSLHPGSTTWPSKQFHKFTKCIIYLKTTILNLTNFSNLFLRFVASMDFYGFSLGVDILPGSVFLNVFIVGAIELPSYVMTCVLLNKVIQDYNCGTSKLSNPGPITKSFTS